jgi:hypothetical protein
MRPLVNNAGLNDQFLLAASDRSLRSLLAQPFSKAIQLSCRSIIRQQSPAPANLFSTVAAGPE